MSILPNSRTIVKSESQQRVSSNCFLTSSIVGVDSSPGKSEVHEAFNGCNAATSLPVHSYDDSRQETDTKVWTATGIPNKFTSFNGCLLSSTPSNPYLARPLSKVIHSSQEPVEMSHLLVRDPPRLGSQTVSVTSPFWNTGITSLAGLPNCASSSSKGARFPNSTHTQPCNFTSLWSTPLLLPAAEKDAFTECKKDISLTYPSTLPWSTSSMSSTSQTKTCTTNRAHVDPPCSHIVSNCNMPPKKRHLQLGANHELDYTSTVECTTKKLRPIGGPLESAPQKASGSDGSYVAQLKAPLHYFRRGGKVRLHQESLLSAFTKTVEEMTLQDFLYSAAISQQRLVFLRLLEIDSCVSTISNTMATKQGHKSTADGGILLRFLDMLSGKKVELQLPYASSPLFTWEYGWCSCDPLQTFSLLDFPCSQLQIGLTCLSLLQSNSSTTGADNNVL